ncbi:LOW QUALITY PROTEIN: retrotransposon Gag-like protein 3 [Trichechus inunguis]
MVEDLTASYVALKLENEILQAHVQWLMEENAALLSQISELQKPRAAKEDEPLQKPSEFQDPQQPSDPLDPPAAWKLQEPLTIKKSQKPTESQDFPAAWEHPAAQKPQKTPMAQEIQKPLDPPATEDPQELPMVHELPSSWELYELPEAKEPHKPPMVQEARKPPATKEAQEPSETRDAPTVNEPQNLESDPPNAQESQEAVAHQETSARLEPLELPALQEPLGHSDAQNFLELSAPQEPLHNLITIKISVAPEFPQSPSRLEAAAFPLEYPLVFSGQVQMLPEFLVQLNNYMGVRWHLYPTKAALVSFVSQHFSGEAGKWFQPLVDIQSPQLEQFESFIVLQDTSGNSENIQGTSHCILQLCQGEEPVHQYTTHFHLIAQELTRDESTLCIQFQEGLSSSYELSHRSPATNLFDLIPQCISLEENLGGKPDSNPSGASPSEEGDSPESPPVQNQFVQAASHHPPLSEAEQARCLEGHLCLYCGHPGHFARDCPVKPHSVQQAGNIEARG